MGEIQLDDAKINYEGEWLSVEDLTRMIQEKIQAGDMKFAKMAGALEELKKALENSVTIDTKLVISKEAYEKLRSMGGEDDRECVHKAIQAFIGVVETPVAEKSNEGAPADGVPASEEKKATVVKCAKCKAPIAVPSGKRPLEIKCPKCGATGRLKS
jgi:hypothetical protein